MTSLMSRETWTDERLDDLSKRVDDGFSETRNEFRSLRQEMREEFKSVRAEIAQGVASQNRLMLIGFLGVIATILTQT